MSDTNYPRIRVQKQPPVPRVRLRVLPSLLPLDVSMQATATEIQWRVGDGPWQDLIPLSAFAPPAGDILALLLTVDGAGSGLDADLLDGRNSSTYQTQDAGLDALAAVTGAGILVETATDTYALRTLQAPAAGITITNPAGTAGDPTLVLANDLAALEGLASTGFAARTATDTWAQRTLANAAAGITWTNPAGIAGNPTPVLANDLAALEGLGSTGIAVRTAADTWAQRSIAVPAAGIGISNADGSAGNPTLSLTNDLAALEALSGTSTIYYRSGVDTWTAVTVSANLGFSAGTLGSSLGTMATQGAGAVAITGGSITGITDLAVADGGTGSSTASGARTNLGVAIGTDVEAWSARLDDLAGASWAQGDIAYYNGTNLVRLGAGTSGWFLKTQGAGANPVWAAISGGGDLLSTNNLSDLTNKPTARTNLGSTTVGDAVFVAASAAAARTALALGTAATQNTGTSGANVPLLNAANTWSAAQSITTAALDLQVGQIAFPATQNPSANANTLDDYEEGTWTPQPKFGGNSVGMTFSLQAGQYTKIGNLVEAGFEWFFSAKGSSTGAATGTGLPFTINNQGGFALFKYYSAMASISGAMCGDLQSATTLFNIDQGGTTGVTQLTEANFTNGTFLYGAAIYNAA